MLFVGHSDAPETLYDDVFRSIGWLYVKEGITEFWSGGYGAFDRMCERAVRSWKQSGADMQLVLVLAYPPAVSPLSRNRCSDFDEVYLPDLENVPYPIAIAKRNQLIAAKAEHVLAWVQRDFGGAAKTLAVAERAGATIHRITPS